MTIRILFVILAFLFSGMAKAEIDWNDSNVKWYGYVDGLMEAKKQGKNVVLVVYADWCSVCKQYSNMFFDSSVIAASNNVILVRLNQDQDAHYLKKFSLDGEYVPRTYILDSSFNVQPSPFKSKKYDFYLPPGNAEYLTKLFKQLKT